MALRAEQPERFPTPRKRKPAAILPAVLNHVVLIGLGWLFILPIVWMISTSLKSNGQIVEWPPTWIPKPFVPQNYTGALEAAPLGTYALNTLTITALSVLGALISNPIIAYGLSRLKWRGRELVFYITLGTLMLPFQVTMIPLFVMFSHLGWVNTFLPLIVPCFFGNAFFIFFLRQIYFSIPEELSEAARVEGASDLQILWHIILPLARPALLTIALFQFLASWNDFLGPLLYLNDDSKFTLALGLANMQSALGLSDFGQIMAAASMVAFPAILIFMLAQRYFIEGIASTGLKG
ncbi:MAG: sugar ABC transporter permease [Chloroflexota bacterium]